MLPAIYLMKKLPITVCMVSGAEAERIGRSLASVSEWVDEIVIVLNEEVADSTEEVARAYGAKIFREPWKGYVRQKQSACVKASNQWLLLLDSDESVSRELRRSIERLFASDIELNRFAAYSFPRCTLFCGRWLRHGDWYPDLSTRLWRKDLGSIQGKDPHDKVQVNGNVGRLRGDLLHYSVRSINHQLGKIPNYADYFVRERRAAGRTARWIDLTFRPCWTFFRGYILRRGFLDGWQGYYVARMNAFTTLTRYAKLREAESLDQSR